MPAKPVAVQGEVSATVGKKMFTGADSGIWTAGPITVSSYDNLKSAGKKVIWRAECTFTFAGKAGTSSITGTEKVTLSASAKLLGKHQHSVLVDGDAKTGGNSPPTFDNTLSVSAAGLLKTA